MQPITYQNKTLQFGKKTHIMGILNITPDSFSDGGKYLNMDQALQHAEEMIRDGADLIDVGGESTQPGSEPLPEEEELHRVIPVIERLAKTISIPISVDTYKASVARAALDAGAWIINDISGFTMDPEMAPLAAEKKCPAILMHMKGTPRNMQQNPVYKDVVSEVIQFLREQIEKAKSLGIPENNLIIDPGIGFAKTMEHNLEILRRLEEFKILNRPILIGTSRKATLGKLLGGAPPQDRLEGTAATVALGIAYGADIVRVHDVKEMARVARVSDAIVRGTINL